jgi:hypothetical protein
MPGDEDADTMHAVLIQSSIAKGGGSDIVEAGDVIK